MQVNLVKINEGGAPIGGPRLGAKRGTCDKFAGGINGCSKRAQRENGSFGKKRETF